MSDASAEAGSGAGSPAPSGSSPGALLLVVQAHDTAVDQLRHRHQTLPARDELRQAEEQLASLQGSADVLVARQRELAASQADLERQVEAARERRRQIEDRMRGGQVTAARDLTAMDEEVRHLGEHVRQLEDRELELMEALEPVDGELGRLEASMADLRARADAARGAIAQAEVEILGAVRDEEDRRRAAAEAVPAPLLAQYERIRARLGGVGAARLVGDTCGGCHLALPSMEVDRIRKAPPDLVVTCDQCGRILVR